MTAHHWGRQLRSLGHDVRLIATKFVRPFVKNNKTDAADAQAIWESAQRPGMRFVPVKTEQQQAILVLHAMRDGLVKGRTAQLHQIRAAFYELGIDLPEGRTGASRICRQHSNASRGRFRPWSSKRCAVSSS